MGDMENSNMGKLDTKTVIRTLNQTKWAMQKRHKNRQNEHKKTNLWTNGLKNCQTDIKCTVERVLDEFQSLDNVNGNS